MKKIGMVSLLLVVSSFASAQEAFDELREIGTARAEEYGEGFWIVEPLLIEQPGHQETSRPLLSPEQLEEMEQLPENEIEALLRFPQTTWNECRDNPSGNYGAAACASQRRISVVLNGYLEKSLLRCVDEGLEAQGGGRARAVHINHAGITGDARHSPRSLHAENRAIDIKMLKVRLSNGTEKQFTYSVVGNRPFYTALRKCWGEIMHRDNKCPLQKGQTLYTGSIGWEDKNHGAHMHLSVPYCVNGAYSSSYFQR